MLSQMALFAIRISLSQASEIECDGVVVRQRVPDPRKGTRKPLTGSFLGEEFASALPFSRILAGSLFLETAYELMVLPRTLRSFVCGPRDKRRFRAR